MKNMAKAVSTARARMDWRAAPKAASMLSPKKPVARASCVKACRMRMDPMASVAKAELSANRSCAKRCFLRTQRPKPTSGSTINGIAPSTRRDICGLVTTIITPPRRRAGNCAAPSTRSPPPQT